MLVQMGDGLEMLFNALLPNKHLKSRSYELVNYHKFIEEHWVNMQHYSFNIGELSTGILSLIREAFQITLYSLQKIVSRLILHSEQFG